MKTITTIFVLAFIVLLSTSMNAYSQNPASCDTFDIWSFASPTLYSAIPGGYIIGNNGYGDKAKAQHYSLTDTFTISEIGIWFGAKRYTSLNPSSSIAIKLYDMDGTGVTIGGTAPAPGTVLASINLPVSDIDTTAGSSFMFFTLPNPIELTDDYALGVDLSGLAPGDTVGIVGSMDGEVLGAEMSWDQESDNTWLSMLAAFGIDVHPFIIPVGCGELDEVVIPPPPPPVIPDNGFYPDCITGLAPGTINALYNEELGVTVNTDTTLYVEGEGVLNLDVNSLTITSVSGLPPGINYSCDPASCVFLPSIGNGLCDTVYGTLFDESPTWYGHPNGQFLVGNNPDGILANAQAFRVTTPVIISEVAFWFAGKVWGSANPLSEVTVKLQSLNGSGLSTAGTVPAPGTVLASASLSINLIDTVFGNLTYVPFPDVVISGDYAVVIEYGNLLAGDSVGLITNGQNNVVEPEMSWFKVANNNTWYTALEAYNEEFDISIFPIYCGTDPMSVTFSGTPTATGIYPYDIYYTLSVTDPVLGTFNIQDTLSCELQVIPDGVAVWPGDANSDGVADNYDMLPLGLYFNSSGPVRGQQGILWQAYASADWTATQYNGANMKHADCNGDGVIDINDSLAVVANFGFTHNKTYDMKTLSSAPDLYFVFNQPVYDYGDTIIAELFLGTSANPATDIYGLAADITYNAGIITAGSGDFDFNNSFMGNQTLTLGNTSDANGVAKFAITRTNQVNVSGYGKIAELRFIANSGSSTTFDLEVVDYMLIDADGDEILLNPVPASITVGEPELADAILIYPNPAGSSITLDLGTLFNTKAPQLNILNATGQLVYQATLSAARSVINISSFTAGIYFMDVDDGNTRMRKKFIKQ